jgi:hypothetical protein
MMTTIMDMKMLEMGATCCTHAAAGNDVRYDSNMGNPENVCHLHTPDRTEQDADNRSR